jgi:hypothetical protein
LTIERFQMKLKNFNGVEKLYPIRNEFDDLTGLLIDQPTNQIQLQNCTCTMTDSSTKCTHSIPKHQPSPREVSHNTTNDILTQKSTKTIIQWPLPLKLCSFNMGKHKYKFQGIKLSHLKKFAKRCDVIVLPEGAYFTQVVNMFSKYDWIKIDVRAARETTTDYVFIGILKKSCLKLVKVHPAKTGYVICDCIFHGKEISIVCTHLKWKEERYKSRNKCLARFSEKDCSIVIGDLNMEPCEILNHANFNEKLHSIVITKKREKQQYVVGETTIRGGRKDNFLYTTEHFSLESFAIGEFYSDHYPVKAKFLVHGCFGTPKCDQMTSKEEYSQKTVKKESKEIYDKVDANSSSSQSEHQDEYVNGSLREPSKQNSSETWKFYKGGQFIKGGRRASKGGIWVKHHRFKCGESPNL